MDKRWICINKKQPLPGERVLVILDYTGYGREKRVEIANVHFAEEKRRYGGPNSLTGDGWLQGLYFSIPSIVAPNIVTHWMIMPKP